MSGALTTLSDFVGWNPDQSDQVSVVILRGTKAWKITTWTSVVIRMGVEIMPWTAALGLTTQQANPISKATVSEGDGCLLYIGQTLVFTGYVQTVVEEIGPDGHTIEVQLASRSVDLVECAAEFSTFQMNSTNALDIARRVCQFAQIDVISVGGAGDTDIQAFAVILSETAYEVIERVSRLAAVIFYDRPDGNICMSAVGTRRAASGFTLGRNIERLQRVRSMAGRYSTVQAIVMGEVTLFTMPGASNAYAEQMTVLSSPANAKATDPGVTRTRNMLVPIEIGDEDGKVAKQRVLWEVNRRYGRAYPITLTCDSWRDRAGNLWLPNTLARLDLGDGNPQDLLIGELTLRQTVDDGTHADVVLMDPAAFAPEPIINPLFQTAFQQAIQSNQGAGQSAAGTESM